MESVVIIELLALPGMALAVLGLHSLRPRYGQVPLLAFLAGLGLALQMLSPSAAYFVIGAGQPVAVASVTMVPAVLFGLLLVYVVDGTPAARLTVVAVLSGTVIGTVITALHGMVVRLPGAENLAGLPPESRAFDANFRAMFGSTVALVGALYVIAIVYQTVANRLGHNRTAVAAGAALLAGVATDSVVFHTLLNVGTPQFLPWFGADILVKFAAGIILWPFAAVYIIRTQPLGGDDRPLRRPFDLLLGQAGAAQRALEAAEDARRSSEARYRELVEQASDGIMILDADGRIEEANRRAETMLGASPGSLVGTDFADHVDPESLRRRPLRIPEVLAGNTAITERELVRAEGGHVPVEISARLVPGRRILAIIRDLTERRRAEEKLRASEEFHRRILETAYEVTTIVDRHGIIRYQSPGVRTVLGYEPGDLEGVNAFDRVHPDDVPAAREAFSRALHQPGIPVDVEVRLMSRESGWRTVAASLADLQDSEAISGIVIRYKDVTQERLLREQLQQAQKMESIGRLAGGIAHDFNNLLTAILGHAAFAEGELAPDDAVVQEIREISAAADRAAALTQKLLAFARKQVSKPDVVDLCSVVTGLQPMLTRVMSEDINIDLDLEEGGLWIRIDPGLLEQVLVNFAVNARDAMPRGGTLTIRARRARALDQGDAEQVRLTVSDTGAGIPHDVVDHIFEPFFTTKPAGKGTGLGLATCYGIVKQAGGDIKARTRDGEGTTFDVFFPAVDAPDGSAHDEQRPDMTAELG